MGGKAGARRPPVCHQLLVQPRHGTSHAPAQQPLRPVLSLVSLSLTAQERSAFSLGHSIKSKVQLIELCLNAPRLGRSKVYISGRQFIITPSPRCCLTELRSACRHVLVASCPQSRSSHDPSFSFYLKLWGSKTGISMSGR